LITIAPRFRIATEEDIANFGGPKIRTPIHTV